MVFPSDESSQRESYAKNLNRITNDVDNHSTFECSNSQETAARSEKNGFFLKLSPTSAKISIETFRYDSQVVPTENLDLEKRRKPLVY